MSLRIVNLRFRDFRNYPAFDLRDIGPITVFVGENAVGKTNVIEGIQLLTSLSSFRHPKTEYLLRDGAASAYIEQDVSDGSRNLTLRLEMEDGHKAYSLNGKRKKTADLKGLLPSVIFTPDDLELAKGSNSVRRTALDSLGSQLSKNHYAVKKDYEKVLQHKNRLLKEEADALLIENINEMMVTCGAQLSWYRANLVARIAPYLQESYSRLCGGREAIQMAYIPSWTRHLPGGGAGDEALLSRDAAREGMRRALEESIARERKAQRSIIGPHTDEVAFSLNGKNAGLFASQGQQRSIVLAYKLAELLFIKDTISQKPVLLLDDVMSELDGSRRKHFLTCVEDDIQTFITTTNLDYFSQDFLGRVTVVHLPMKESGA